VRRLQAPLADARRSAADALRLAPARVAAVRPPRTWEGWAVIALLALALGTRLWDLGGRVLHYDEVLHALYSWNFAVGEGYQHNPLTHGPFLFHAGAATYKIIGASDFAARLLPALFGAALVISPWLFRRELGRFGALAVSLFLLISPTILYFSRFMRNDVYMAVWAVALLALALRYMERPRRRLLFAWAVIWALAFATKESAFFLAGMFGLLLLILAARPLWEWVRNLRPLSRTGPASDLLIVMGTLTLPMWAPAAGLFQRFTGAILVNPDLNNPRVQSGELFRAEGVTGQPIGGAIYAAVFLVLALTAVSVVVGTAWNRRVWPLLFAAFAAVWLLLFTSLFSNWQGFLTGIWGSLGYWIAQQGVERANQPWYYYVIGLSVYEFLIAGLAVAGGVCLLARRRSLFDVVIVCWAALSFAIYSLAGERMPWLLTGIALPIAFVAGRAAGLVAERVAEGAVPALTLAFAGGAALGAAAPYAAIRAMVSDDPAAEPGFWAACAVIVIVAAAFAEARIRAFRARRRAHRETTAQPAQPPAPSAARAARRTSAPRQTRRRRAEPPAPRRSPLRRAAAVAARLGAPLRFAARTLPRLAPRFSPGLAVFTLGLLTAAAGMTVFFSVRASYSHASYERPRELLVYSQTGQEARYALQCIESASESAGLRRDGARVLVDEHDNLQWQWRWYLRGRPFFTRNLNSSPLETPPDAEFVLMSQWSEDANAAQMENYVHTGEMHTLWWFNNATYAGLTPGKILDGAASRDGWRMAIDYLMSRRVGTEMQYARSAFYVRSDLAPFAEDCLSLRYAQESDA